MRGECVSIRQQESGVTITLADGSREQRLPPVELLPFRQGADEHGLSLGRPLFISGRRHRSSSPTGYGAYGGGCRFTYLRRRPMRR